VLERRHRPGVDIDVGIELLYRDPQPAGDEQTADGRGGDALSERGDDAAGDEDEARALFLLGHEVSLEGFPAGAAG
jgi:hypothetical protein